VGLPPLNPRSPDILTEAFPAATVTVTAATVTIAATTITVAAAVTVAAATVAVAAAVLIGTYWWCRRTYPTAVGLFYASISVSVAVAIRKLPAAHDGGRRDGTLRAGTAASSGDERHAAGVAIETMFAIGRNPN